MKNMIWMQSFEKRGGRVWLDNTEKSDAEEKYKKIKGDEFSKKTMADKLADYKHRIGHEIEESTSLSRDKKDYLEEKMNEELKSLNEEIERQAKKERIKVAAELLVILDKVKEGEDKKEIDTLREMAGLALATERLGESSSEASAEDLFSLFEALKEKVDDENEVKVLRALANELKNPDGKSGVQLLNVINSQLSLAEEERVRRGLKKNVEENASLTVEEVSDQDLVDYFKGAGVGQNWFKGTLDEYVTDPVRNENYTKYSAKVMALLYRQLANLNIVSMYKDGSGNVRVSELSVMGAVMTWFENYPAVQDSLKSAEDWVEGLLGGEKVDFKPHFFNYNFYLKKYPGKLPSSEKAKEEIEYLDDLNRLRKQGKLEASFCTKCANEAMNKISDEGDFSKKAVLEMVLEKHIMYLQDPDIDSKKSFDDWLKENRALFEKLEKKAEKI